MTEEELLSFYGDILLMQLRDEFGKIKFTNEIEIKRTQRRNMINEYLSEAVKAINCWKPPEKTPPMGVKLRRLSKYLNSAADYMTENPELGEFLMLGHAEPDSPFSNPLLPYPNLLSIMKECADRTDVIEQKLARGRPPEYFKQALTCSLVDRYLKIFGSMPTGRRETAFNAIAQLLFNRAGYASSNPERLVLRAVKIVGK